MISAFLRRSAPLGTHERFIGGNQSPASSRRRLRAGNFPLWLAPDQVRVITIGDDEPLVNYAKSIVNELRANFVRVDGDYSTNKINSDKSRARGKIQDAEKAKVHTMLVIGGRDLETGNVSVHLHGKGNVGTKPKGEAVADILAAIKERRA